MIGELNNRSMYSRPDKPMFIPVKRRSHLELGVTLLKTEAIPVVDKSTECHVTPPEVCQRMVDYAEPNKTDIVIEPHFGTGNILDAMLNSDDISSKNIIGVERHIALFGYTTRRLENHELNLFNDCFLEYAKNAKEKVDIAILNPPFKKLLLHFEAAISLLNSGGRIIALVPTNFDYEGAIELEKLPDTTFLTTKVSTKIIAYYL